MYHFMSNQGVSPAPPAEEARGGGEVFSSSSPSSSAVPNIQEVSVKNKI